ncbi:MAG: hypothetical protein NTX88_09390 [Candidatus Atribacteria bacterium]|nr:hypothetical protein [Candidatus Atribacteria bacterium]
MKVVVLGSTGYLGEQILEVLSEEAGFKVVLLSGWQNISKLQAQISQYHVPYGFLMKQGVPVPEIPGVVFFPNRLEMEAYVLSEEVEGVFFASAGIDFVDLFWKLLPTGKKIWMASKEIIVSVGEFVRSRFSFPELTQLIPLDSEHNAIWQMIHGKSRSEVEKIYLTASGGSFYEWMGEMNAITPEMALSHPNWKMGTKITVDSANLVNKGLEVMEASYLFDFPFDQIDVIVQRESVIHALIEMRDGFIFALLSQPDMKAVVRHALSPQERQNNRWNRLDFSLLKGLRFDYPVPERFRGFYLAREAGKRGGGYPAFFCGADEACVRAFLLHQLQFGEIPVILEKTLEKDIPVPGAVEDVMMIYKKGFHFAETLIRQIDHHSLSRYQQSNEKPTFF